MKKRTLQWVSTAVGLLGLCAVSAAEAVPTQILAKVGGQSVTNVQLEQALASSPFATIFPGMDEKLQAGIRGNMLKRLINAELLYLEASQQGVDRRQDFSAEMEAFRLGLLTQKYYDHLRAGIKVPAEVDQALIAKYGDDPDALAAARSMWTSRAYGQEKADRLKAMRQKYAIRLYPDRIQGAKADTLLADGDGFHITYGQLRNDADQQPLTPAGVRQRLQERVDLLVTARGALEAGVEVDDELAEYRHRLLAQMLLKQKEDEWIPREQVLRDYFIKNREIGQIPVRYHVSQIVLATRQQAEALRKRILAGESLHALASEYSIDPYGQKNAGDMGWRKLGNGMPQLESVIGRLEDKELSEVIETPKGFHVLMVSERTPKIQKTYNAVHDRVRRAFLLPRLENYMQKLANKYPVELFLPNHQPAP